MLITELQKKTITSIVHLFESGHLLGNYGAVSQNQNDHGGLSFGVSQASLNSGALYQLLAEYCSHPDAQFKDILIAWLPLFKIKNQKLNFDKDIVGILKQSATDKIMQQTQDYFFDINYWQPAYNTFTQLDLALPLSLLVIYDSFIQGGFITVRQLFKEVPPSNGGDELLWVKAYVKARRNWLYAKGGLLAKTIYRMENIQDLIDDGNWNLNLPLTVRNILITEEKLTS